MTDRDLQQKRIVAGVIDIAIAVVIWVVFVVLSWGATFVLGRATGDGMASTYLPRLVGFAGALVGLGYILGRDLLAGGRSFGKQIQGLRVTTTSGSALTPMDSARRNAPFAIGAAFSLLSATLGLIPCLGDVVNCMLLPLLWLGHLVSLGVAIFEIIKITQDPDGIRMGDQIANTRVIR